jgi:tRNA(Ile)-lysidine synthase
MPRHDASVPWQGEAALTAPGGLGEVVFHRTRGGGIAVRSLADRQVELRLRRGGERIRPDCRRPRRTLKNLLQEYRIDPWRRARLPLLFCDDHLVWVPGIGVDCTWQAGPGEASITPEWRLRPPQAGAGAGRSLQSRQD